MTTTTTPTCIVCHSRKPDHGQTCEQCRVVTLRHLDGIGELAERAAAELLPGSTGGGGRSTEISIGLRVEALDLDAGFDVVPALDSWAQDWREVQGHSTGPVTCRVDGLPHAHVTLTTSLAYLIAHLAWAADHHPAFDEFAREVASLHAATRRAVRDHAPHVHVVTCPADMRGDDGEWTRCGHRLVMRDLDLEAHVRCDRCQLTWTVKRLMLVAASDSASELWLAEADLALIVGVASRTLRRWAKMGEVKRRRGLYELASVRAHIEAEVGQTSA